MAKIQHGDHVVQVGAVFDHHGLYLRENGRDCVIHHTGAWDMIVRRRQGSCEGFDSDANALRKGASLQVRVALNGGVFGSHAVPSCNVDVDEFLGFVRPHQVDVAAGTAPGKERERMSSAARRSDDHCGDDASTPSDQVILEFLPEGIENSPWRFHSRPSDPEAAVVRAKAEVGATHYNAWTQNSEHYTNYWCDGLHWSEQKRAVLWAGGSFALAGSMAMIAGVGATAPAFLGSKALGSAAASSGLVASSTSFGKAACGVASAAGAVKSFTFCRIELHAKRLWRQHVVTVSGQEAEEHAEQAQAPAAGALQAAELESAKTGAMPLYAPLLQALTENLEDAMAIAGWQYTAVFTRSNFSGILAR